MANNNLFGTLQTPLKPIHYTGIDTKTIDVIVDSENRTIRANIQPEVMNVISGNVSALKAAYEKLTSLSKEIDQVEKVIANIYNELNQNIYTLKSDTQKIFTNIERIEKEYATQVEVKQWIDDARIPQAELNTYAKAADVAEEVSRLEDNIALKADIEDVEQFINDTTESIREINNSINETNTRIDTFEASIGPLPEDKTLKEEIFDTFATKEELDEVQNKAGQNSVLLRDVESELFDINKSLEDDYATKEFVTEEISKIDIPDTDLSNYYTKEEVDDKIANIDIPVGPGGDIDLADYYTKSQTESKIEEALNSITLITASIDSI